MSEDGVFDRAKKDDLENANDLHIRWYHIVATVVVAALMITAFVVFFRRFNPSLVGSEQTLQIAAHCDGAQGENRYFGVAEKDLFVADESGNVSKTTNRDEALLEVLALEGSQVKVNVKNDDEWVYKYFHYGATESETVRETESCKLVLDYVFSR